MNKQPFQILFSGGRSTYSPGETLKGVVSWNTSHGVTGLHLRYGWVTNGSHGTQAVCHAEQYMVVTGTEGEASFECPLPDGPCSFAGNLFSVSWIFEVQSADMRYLVQEPFLITNFSSIRGI